MRHRVRQSAMSSAPVNAFRAGMRVSVQTRVGSGDSLDVMVLLSRMVMNEKKEQR